MDRYAFLDIETSGLNPVLHEPIEVAYILEPDEVTVGVSLPFHEDTADPMALEVNGYGKRPFLPMMDSFTFAKKLHGDLRDRIIVGNNVQFDMNFLREFLSRVSPLLLPTWQHHVVDLKAIAGGALGLEPPWKTNELCELLSVDPPGKEAHTALGDARWNLMFYKGIYSYLNRTVRSLR